MSYGDRGPPAGYSTPRNVKTDASSQSKQCQRCKSTTHWTFECPSSNNTAKTAAASSTTSSTAAKPSVKLSRTQMLRLGLVKPLTEALPPKSEIEQYKEELDAATTLLIEEEKRRKQQQSSNDAPQGGKEEAEEEEKEENSASDRGRKRLREEPDEEADDDAQQPQVDRRGVLDDGDRDAF